MNELLGKKPDAVERVKNSKQAQNLQRALPPIDSSLPLTERLHQAF